MSRRWREQDIPRRAAAMRSHAAAGRMVTLHRVRLDRDPRARGGCVSCGLGLTLETSDPSSSSGRCVACDEAARRVVWGGG